MKDNSFAMAMEKIVGQAEAEQQQEIRVQKRAEIIVGHVRSVFIFLLVATIFVFAFCYREQIQNAIFSNSSTQQSGGQTSAALNAAKQNAATRDSALDSITK